MKFDWAPSAFKALNGVFCVYKPADMSIRKLLSAIKTNITRDLNRLPCYRYELDRYRHLQDQTSRRRCHLSNDAIGANVSPNIINIPANMISADVPENMISTDVPANMISADVPANMISADVPANMISADVPANVISADVPANMISTDVPANMVDMSDHRLVLGPRYIEDDIKLGSVTGMNYLSSGVLVMAVGSRQFLLRSIARARFVRVYHIKGRLGLSTQDFTPHGNIIERTSYFHVRKSHIDKICSSLQTSHRKRIFEYAGVQPDTQEAYELAKFGLVRPVSNRTPPIIYDVRCIQFDPPHFTLEVQTTNETSAFFMNLIHELGYSVKSGAVCEHIHRLRYGYFTTEHALLRRYWTLDAILTNIDACRGLLTRDKLRPGPALLKPRESFDTIERHSVNGR